MNIIITLVSIVTFLNLTNARFHNDVYFREMLAELENRNRFPEENLGLYTQNDIDDDRLAEFDDGFEPEDAGNPFKARMSEEPQTTDIDAVQSTETREPEEELSNPLWGYQYVSGGAGEGKQHLTPNGAQENKQEVKTDAHLPAYCNPPNPCPKGYKDTTKCQPKIPDTVEFNRRYNAWQQRTGACKCDKEHMRNCPDDSNTVSTKKDLGNQGEDSLDELIRSLLGSNEDMDNNPMYANGVKRDSLVAKKFSAHMIEKRAVDNEIEKEWLRTPHGDDKQNNPYLAGDKLGTVAKKGAVHF